MNILVLVFLFILCPRQLLLAQNEATQLDDPQMGLPVRELVVFKDGHVLVHHQGQVVLDDQKAIAFRDLPKPVMGTFWPSVRTPGWKIDSTTAGWRMVAEDRNVSTLAELIRENCGTRVMVTEKDDVRYSGRLLKADAIVGTIVLIEVEEGLKAVPIARIRDVTFLDAKPKTKRVHEERKRVLAYSLSQQDKNAGAKVELGLSYVSSGFRWIPSYRIEVDGEGKALVHMRATLVNDLRDLDDCLIQLVVGVPNFSFSGMADPMALSYGVQQVGSQLSNFASNYDSNMFSNAVRTQVFNPSTVASTTTPATEYQFGAGRAVEDFYVFSVPGITLKKNERMSVALGSFELSYSDHYVLEIPVQVPGEIRSNYQPNRTQWDKLASMPKVMHQIRLRNRSKIPLTTAPALIFSKGRVVSQSLLRYTPAGGLCSLDLSKAIDIHVEKEDFEVGRVADAKSLGRRTYHQVNYSGRIRLANHGNKKIALEVNRYLIGHMDETPQDGAHYTLSPFDDLDTVFGPTSAGSSYRGWASWWRQVNAVEKVSWTVVLDPKQERSLGYTWHYYWR